MNRMWRQSLLALPSVGVSILPKLACPACWPAYAGLLTSTGLGFLISAVYLLPLKKKIEVFSAGCSTCQETIELVKRLSGSSHEVLVHDMQKSEVASKAKQYGVRSVPAVVIDGKLAGCCAGRGPDEQILRSALTS
jgi:glutaredoxin